MQRYYIAYQRSKYERGGYIYAIGNSAEEAMNKAEREAVDVPPLFAAECTKELYDAVSTDGGAVKWELTCDFPPAKLAAK